MQLVCAVILTYLFTKTIFYYNKEHKTSLDAVGFVYAAYVDYILMIVSDALWAILEYHHAPKATIYIVNIVWHA
ncbi:MAG: hypothetical protein IK121_09230 [Lachnospiraceae bacterium]|nr:hypothetical protein [Lachnospiraceae bacterium]